MQAFALYLHQRAAEWSVGSRMCRGFTYVFLIGRKSGSAGIPRHVCSRLLNHAERGVTSEHYDMYDMFLERVDIIHSVRHYAGRLYQVARAFPCRRRSSALTNSRSLSLRVF